MRLHQYELEPLMAIISDGIRLLDREFRVIYANPSFLELCGLDANKVMGQRCHEVLGTPFCHTPDCYLERSVRGKEINPSELMARRNDGSTISAVVNAVPLTDASGEFVAFAEVFRGIREPQQTEKWLRQPEESYRSLIELADRRGEAVVMLRDTGDKEAVFTFISDCFLEITGYQREELLGRSFFDLVSPEDRVASQMRHRQKMSGKALPGLFELTLIARDGHRVATELVSSTASYQGKMINVAYIRDITTRKQMEQDLLSYQKHLEEMVTNRTQELQKANLMLREEIAQRKKAEDNLKKEMARRAEFTRALAHELKTPLTPLLGASELLQSEITTEPLKSLTQSVYRGALQLGRRVDELLDMAKGEVGMLKLKLQKVAPAELLQDTMRYISNEAARFNHRVVLDIDNELPVIAADEDRLRQVILNLLNNAVKFTPPGSIVTVKAHQQDGELIIEVEDNGPGIPPEKSELIFQPYHRLDNQAEHLGGLGLGLALSKMLVELHHGRIWAKNRKGGGAIFGFSIPINLQG